MEERYIPHAVIVGGGFAGLYAAKRLKRQPTHVTVLDRSNYHLFQSFLYQVATAGLSPGDRRSYSLSAASSTQYHGTIS